MKEYRSASQIAFGFLPEQTVDLRGKVWKVKEWLEPRPRSLEPEILRKELERQVGPWAQAGKDGKYLEQLRSGYGVRLCSLNRETGVRVEKFPQNWVCKSCNRLYQSKEPETCQCGSGRFGQLPFVAFHDECGAIQTPFIKPCAQHKQVRIIWPGTARAEEIVFDCPVCVKTLQKGFGFRSCECGKGRLTFNVHRAASVYTPHSLVIINPPSIEKAQRVREAGGPSRALSWVLADLKAASFSELELTQESLKATLLKEGIPAALIDGLVQKALEGGAFSKEDSPINLSGLYREQAESGATSIALALADSRLRVEDLVARSPLGTELRRKYSEDYPAAFSRIGLGAIEFLDSFPVVTGCYGYTRGDSTPGAARLVPFKDRRNRTGEYVVYGEMLETEALFVRLRPTLVAKWLTQSGVALRPWTDDRSARLSLLQTGLIPRPGEQRDRADPGAKILTLIHSYAHWFTRQVAVHSGIDRNALSEYLVPQHCAFFIYAANRGDFVLGGLQALFESDLDGFLNELASSDLRCPLDPGCLRAGGACIACLHLGEPSCRYYNSYLSRPSLMRNDGYLLLAATAESGQP